MGSLGATSTAFVLKNGKRAKGDCLNNSLNSEDYCSPRIVMLALTIVE